MLTDPTAVFIYLASLVGGVFWLTGLKPLQPLFRVTPAVIYAYFLPALSTSLGITPQSSAAYDWMVRYLLPVSLLLLMVTVDLRAVIRLGGKALIMMLAGSLGIIIGGPIALLVLGPFLPEDTWMGLAALGGSWIGGAPNMVAIKESVGTPDSLMGPIIVVDTVVAYGWMGVLLFLSGMQKKFDRWLRADTRDLDALDGRLTEVDGKRVPDPAAVEGDEVTRIMAFRQAFRALENRIETFLNLPLASLDRLRLQVVYGEGIANYMNDGGMDLARERFIGCDVDEDPLEPLHESLLGRTRIRTINITRKRFRVISCVRIRHRRDAPAD